MSLSKFFKLEENNTTIGREIGAGVTTFVTIAYIFIVNPNILSAAGMDKGAVFFATVVSAAIATLCMALLTNYPFALAAGMGLNAFFAYSVASVYGWEVALLAVFVEGLLFILLSLVNFREAIFNAVPAQLKHAVTVGLGLFIAFIGLTNGGIVVGSEATFVELGNLLNITTLLAIVGTFVTLGLYLKNVKGAILLGIFITYGLGVLCQLTGLYVVDPANGVYSLIPAGIVQMPQFVPGYNLISAIKNGGISHINLLTFIPILFTLLFVDVFDTIGTLIGVSSKAGYLDEEGKLPKIKPALLSDAIGTTIGGVLGTSTVTTYVESAAGVAAGGRTGLTGVVVAILMLLTLFFEPIFSVIPSFATAPALILVGIFMFDSVKEINLDSLEEVIPVFFTIVMMPLTYSVSHGIMFGFISYVFVKLVLGKSKEVHPILYVVSLLFLLSIIFA